jgi:radical SAM-linked protein
MSESKQRWRLIFAREDEARFLSHLDAIHLWERAFRRGDIPVATSEGFSPRPRLIFAAPLQLGLLAEHELADLFLAERLTRADLRARLVEGMPRGYRLVDMHDVWVGAPALATQLVAADYRLGLLGADDEVLRPAVARLLAATELKREKRREKKVIAYDLRPLLLDLRIVAVASLGLGELEFGGDTPTSGLWMRLRQSQDLGSGRPEEVVAAIAADLGLALSSPLGSGDGDASEAVAETSETSESAEPTVPGAGRPVIEIIQPVRERLWLTDELPG